MTQLPATVPSTTLEGPLQRADATLERADAVDVVARLKAESDVPLRTHGSLSMNRALMTAGLIDRVEVTVFPVITGPTGARPVFERAADFDLELISSRTFDGCIQELVYRPTLCTRMARSRTVLPCSLDDDRPVRGRTDTRGTDESHGLHQTGPSCPLSAKTRPLRSTARTHQECRAKPPHVHGQRL